ncbi:HAD hydrolase-like protein, partial [Candidatus Dependentiae bacterium]|nr:HAD hydrolase-like protein [Candidatus Dependentiae bacterium]
VEAGKKAGCKTILVKTGDGKKSLKLIDNNKFSAPDYIFKNLMDAAKFIVSVSR